VTARPADFHAVALAGAQDVAHRLDTGAMPGRAGNTLTLGPTVITIHDDGDMAGHDSNQAVEDCGALIVIVLGHGFARRA
jgi:hypothetical protein